MIRTGRDVFALGWPEGAVRNGNAGQQSFQTQVVFHRWAEKTSSR
jgi:hypothetical protein